MNFIRNNVFICLQYIYSVSRSESEVFFFFIDFQNKTYYVRIQSYLNICEDIQGFSYKKKISGYVWFNLEYLINRKLRCILCSCTCIFKMSSILFLSLKENFPIPYFISTLNYETLRKYYNYLSVSCNVLTIMYFSELQI